MSQCRICPEEATEFFLPSGTPTLKGYCRRCLEREIRKASGEYHPRRNNSCAGEEQRGRRSLPVSHLGFTPDMTPTGEGEDD